MDKNKVIVHVLYSGLGGHGNVVFPLLENKFGETFKNILVFYGIEEINQDYINKCTALDIQYKVIPKRQKQYLKAFKTFKTLLIKIKPDAIIIHNNELIIPASKYAKKNAIASIYIEHENNQSKSRLLHFLSKYALKKSSAVVCLNENMISENRGLYGTKGKLVLIHNGIDTSKFKGGKPTEKIIFGLAGRMVAVKDHKNLLLAFSKIVKEYPNAELRLAGDGPLKIKLEKLTFDLGINMNVKFLGLLSEYEMVTFYQKLGVYVHATHAENMSTAILQALSSQLPVITSDIDNNKLIITDGENGWLYKAGDPIDLFEKMKAAIENKPELAVMAAKNRAKAVNLYAVDLMSQKYIELVLSLT